MNWFPLGWGGVQAFLVLSAFFVTKKLYYSNRICFKEELKHRIKRLYPSYLLILLGAGILYILHSHKLPYDIPIFLLSSQNFHWVLFGSTPLSSILGHTWYITLDVYLFILAVLVFKITPPRKWKFISYIGIILSIAWRVACNLIFDNNMISYTIPLGQLDSYCLGSILALNWIEGKTNKFYQHFDILIGLLGVLGCLGYVGHTNGIGFIESYQYFGNSFNYTGSPLLVNIYFFAGLLSVGLLRLCLKLKNCNLLTQKWIITLGNWSYELYLFHYPIVWVFRSLIKNPWLLISITFLLTVFTTYLWHKYLQERIVKIIGN